MKLPSSFPVVISYVIPSPSGSFASTVATSVLGPASSETKLLINYTSAAFLDSTLEPTAEEDSQGGFQGNRQTTAHTTLTHMCWENSGASSLTLAIRMRTVVVPGRGCRHGLRHAILAVNRLEELGNTVVFINYYHSHLRERRGDEKMERRQRQMEQGLARPLGLLWSSGAQSGAVEDRLVQQDMFQPEARVMMETRPDALTPAAVNRCSLTS
ncbi:hypothetical protein EYF80_031411 [Liparis tanakae]|uniref:Uncharacterized protein n=1 Tax=Liparis tanakae TaxID=230148 RepID=A0A4Z2GYR6_9TELE|nr:hypothetical protein EYF80_031411 [Liparis tanakae]